MRTAPSSAGPRSSTSAALLRPRTGWFFGLPGDRLIKLIFQGNAAVSIIVLGLITFTIFRDAWGFMPMNRRNLETYRQAGLEFTDLMRLPVTSHSTLLRYLSTLRQQELVRLTQEPGGSGASANQQLAAYDVFVEHFAATISAHEALLATITELCSSLKERSMVAEDLRQAKQTLLDGMRTAPLARAASLKQAAEAMQIEVIDFKAEVAPLLALRPAIVAANAALVTELQQLSAQLPSFSDAAAQVRLAKFPGYLTQYLAELASTAEQIAAWDQAKPVGVFESLNAFAFGREWITASFWQDWYGIIPLLTGSLLIAFMALLIAIPLGLAAAMYVNQLAGPIEQRIIKPYIEFISAIPSVVLGFFGIAMLGETLRRLSQMPALQWVPGFPMAERLNATTAACLLALMAIPTIFSLAEDAINNVPRAFKEASLALGATRLQTMIRITVPAALSGIMAAILLGFGRVVGETMVVLLCAGNRIEIPNVGAGLGVIFQPVHTMTGIIAQEMGEVVRASIHYRALFMVGVVLFLFSLLVNWLAQKIVRRYRISIG
ncbi:MAG: phosphate ABC transporter permease subunit PstC [Lacunisphaera sp.]|nr:phosphate ABC transporter permease subunit PstC [Lacunisphaera sp.]